MIPSSRKEAIANGSKLYRTTAPCKNGHSANRYTQSGACVACVVAAAQRHRDQEELKYRGFSRRYFLVHDDDVAAVEQIATYLRTERLCSEIPWTKKAEPGPNTEGNHKIKSSPSGLPPVPDSKPDWYVP